jgi:hypothetical protein
MDAARKAPPRAPAQTQQLAAGSTTPAAGTQPGGNNTRTLAADERRLKTSISETTAQLNRQREALARVSAQQAKLNAVKQRYQAGKELAGNARNGVPPVLVWRQPERWPGLR